MAQSSSVLLYLFLSCLFLAVVIALLAVEKEGLKYFTYWNLTLNSVLFFLFALARSWYTSLLSDNSESFDYATVLRSSPLITKPTLTSYTTRYTFLWLFPITFATSVAVCTGSFVMEMVGDMARDALDEHSTAVVWIVNATEHFLPIIMLILSTTLDYKFVFGTILALSGTGSTRSASRQRASERYAVALMTFCIFFVYNAYYNPVHVYNIAMSRAAITASICGTEFVALVCLYLYINYITGQAQTKQATKAV